jgi:hypothetical protein
MRLIYITYRPDQYNPQVGATNSDSRAIVVPESRVQISTLFVFLIVVCAATLVRGASGAGTADGRIAVAVIFGGLLVVLIAGWIVTVRRPRRLEITTDAVRYVRRNGQASTLSRQQGDELRFVKELRGRTWRLGLTIAGTETVMLLGTFSRKAVRQACLARGWRFDDQATVRR